jgi:hypothetical protein
VVTISVKAATGDCSAVERYSGACSLAAGKPAVGQRVPAIIFFAFILPGTSSGAVRAVWPRACRRRGCVPVGASARLPPSRASPGMASCSVVAVSKPPPSGDDRFPVRASHCRGRVREQLPVVWRRPESPRYFVQSGMKAGARLPLSRASSKTFPRGVAAASKPPPLLSMRRRSVLHAYLHLGRVNTRTSKGSGRNLSLD